jgi:hypothetical protein
MSFHVQNGSKVLRYDGSETWPVGEIGGSYDIARVDLPENLIYRRVWCAAWANPNTTGLPRFDLKVCLTDDTGSELEWLKWRIGYGESISTIFSGTVNPLDIRPPYAVTQEDVDPDKSSASHSGAGDARVIQLSDPEYGANRKFRCTMWPMSLSGRFRKARFTISNFSVAGSPDLTGNIYIGWVMQSQLFPFS